jgi:transposase
MSRRSRRSAILSASIRSSHSWSSQLAAEQEAAFGGHISVHPDITSAALQSGRRAEHAVRLSNGAMWSAVNRLGLSLIPTWDNARHPFIS